ncbi:PRC-barrel domain containing protein [Devosia sp. CAU 1758]
MDHSQHPRLMEHELVPEVLEGATIYGAEDHSIGKVSHLHGTGPSAQVIIDVGGFLGLGAKPVSVNMAELDFMRDENGHVHAVTAWTKHDLEHMPEHHHNH